MTARVWNDNVHPYEEEFNREIIHIPAKSYIDMEENDAKLFVRKFVKPVLDGGGTQKPESYKMLRLEMIDPSQQEPDEPTTDSHKVPHLTKMYQMSRYIHFLLL